MVTCDNCGDGQGSTLEQMLEYMLEEGWRKKLVEGSGTLLSECQEGRIDN